MKRYCTVCHKIHEGRRCKPMIARNSSADKFRNTQIWRKKSAAILDRDYHCCRVCYAGGKVCTADLSVHHITPLAVDFDRRLDEDNLITLCRYHHEQAERGAIKAAYLRKLACESFQPQ